MKLENFINYYVNIIFFNFKNFQFTDEGTKVHRCYLNWDYLPASLYLSAPNLLFLAYSSYSPWKITAILIYIHMSMTYKSTLWPRPIWYSIVNCKVLLQQLTHSKLSSLLPPPNLPLLPSIFPTRGKTPLHLIINHQVSWLLPSSHFSYSFRLLHPTATALALAHFLLGLLGNNDLIINLPISSFKFGIAVMILLGWTFKDPFLFTLPTPVCYFKISSQLSLPPGNLWPTLDWGWCSIFMLQ